MCRRRLDVQQHQLAAMPQACELMLQRIVCLGMRTPLNIMFESRFGPCPQHNVCINDCTRRTVHCKACLKSCDRQQSLCISHLRAVSAPSGLQAHSCCVLLCESLASQAPAIASLQHYGSSVSLVRAESLHTPPMCLQQARFHTIH